MGPAHSRRHGLAAARRHRPQTIRPRRLLSSHTASLLAAALASSGCGDDGSTGPRGAFRVVVFGDMPYVQQDTPARDSLLERYAAVLDTIAQEPAAFVVHIGDFTSRDCSDSVFFTRRAEFNALPHPLIYTFGDNEWLNCPGGRAVRLERLDRLRELFTQGTRSLGGQTIALERQSRTAQYATFRENVRWAAGGVQFLALHVVGSNNGRGSSTTPSLEYAERNAANLAWLRDSFAEATRAGHHGVAIFKQANPFEGAPSSLPPDRLGFTEMLEEIRTLAAEFGGPVVLVHGDTHRYRLDQPLRDAQGNVLANVTRAETYGWPRMHALIMTVDPAGPELFTFEPLIVRGNALD